MGINSSCKSPMKKIQNIAYLFVLCYSVACSNSSKHSNKDAQMSIYTDSVVTTETNHTGDSLNVVQQNLLHVTEMLINAESFKASSYFSYPIEFEYPIPPIKDSVEFIKKFFEIFDEDIRHKMLKAKTQGWSEVGWRGYMFDNGMLWSSDEKHITTVNYESKYLKTVRDSLIKEELMSLDVSLQGNWFPVAVYYCKKDRTIARIDKEILEQGDGRYRLALFDGISDLKGKPTVLLYGTLELQGSMANEYYQFADSKNNTAELHEAVLTTVINNNTVSKEVERCCWLEVIEK